ncbi:MAG: tyrosine-type recombinase/integrase, partial [Planctomycetota bacterium]
MGYAGLRRGEAAGLTWDAVDFENRIIHVRANKFYQQLKTELSERPVPPFQELWKILEEHRKAVTHPELVFPRLNWERWTNPSWL